MVERARLLIVCTRNCTEGSNPSHSEGTQHKVSCRIAAQPLRNRPQRQAAKSFPVRPYDSPCRDMAKGLFTASDYQKETK